MGFFSQVGEAALPIILGKIIQYISKRDVNLIYGKTA
jgi:hypothetical protein